MRSQQRRWGQQRGWLSATAKPVSHLICNQKDVVRLAQLMDTAQKPIWKGYITSLTEHRLNQHGRCLGWGRLHLEEIFQLW